MNIQRLCGFSLLTLFLFFEFSFFIAPCQAGENKPVTFKADVYQESFGMIKCKVRGKVYIKYPLRMRTELTMEKPQHSSIILIHTPNIIWIYAPQKRVAEKIDILQVKEEFKDLIPFQLTAYLISPPSHPFLAHHRYENLNFKYLRRELFNGEYTLLYEAKMKNLRGKEVIRVIVRVGEKDKFLRKREEYIGGKLDNVEIFSNVKVNIPLSDSLFEFTPGKDIKVKDNTNSYKKRIETDEKLRKLFKSKQKKVNWCISQFFESSYFNFLSKI